MKRSEFRDIIAESSHLIVQEHRGVCSTLYHKGYFISNVFGRIFKPKFLEGIDGNSHYWLGDKRNLENVERRLTFLAMFEAVILESKEYKDWV